jgi:integrase/recombinase XerD
MPRAGVFVAIDSGMTTVSRHSLASFRTFEGGHRGAVTWPFGSVAQPQGTIGSMCWCVPRVVARSGIFSEFNRRAISTCFRFCRWLEENAVDRHKLSPRYADRYLRHGARRRCPSPKEGPILARFLELLCKNGVIALREAPTRTTPTQQLIAEFILYLRQERELAPTTLANYLPVVRCFLTECFGRDRPLSSLCATNVIEFVQRRALRQSIGHTKLTVSALRSFLRYARYRDRTRHSPERGIVPAIPISA